MFSVIGPIKRLVDVRAASILYTTTGYPLFEQMVLPPE